MSLFSYIFLGLAINKLFANNVNIKPSIFTIHSSNGKDWMYQEKAINIFGFGISIELSISDLSGTNPPSSFLLDFKYFISGELSSGR